MLDMGSPPPMRGIAIAAETEAAAIGITPAHAGNRFEMRFKAASKRDHPRPCGE